MSSLSYSKKTLVLALASLLLMCVFIKQKWAPTAERWNAASAIMAQQIDGTDLNVEKTKLLEVNQKLDQRLLPDNHGKERWEEALSLIASTQKEGGSSLFEIGAEHLAKEQGYTIHSLPLVVTGTSAQVLEFSRAMEEEIASVHVYSLHMKAEKKSYRGKRKLTSRFILRSIRP